MAAKKRDSVQREYDMQVLAKLKHQGKTYEQIRQYLNETTGTDLSLRQLKYDMADMRTKWAKENKAEIEKMLMEELARIESMESLAWAKFYSCTGTKNRETVEEAVPMVKDEDGVSVPDFGTWVGKKRIVVSEDSTADEKFWWGQVTDLQEERRKLLGLYRTKIEVQGKVAHLVKGYVGWTPAAWDGKPELESVVVEDGQFEEVDNG